MPWIDLGFKKAEFTNTLDVAPPSHDWLWFGSPPIFLLTHGPWLLNERRTLLSSEKTTGQSSPVDI